MLKSKTLGYEAEISYSIHYHFGELLNLNGVFDNHLAIIDHVIDILFSHPFAHCHHNLFKFSNCYLSIAS